MYPGQFPRVRQNVWNIVLALDLSRASGMQFIALSVVSIIQRNFPFRWGVVPLVASDEGAKAARLFYYLVDNFGRGNTTAFLRTVRRRASWRRTREVTHTQMAAESTAGNLNFEVARREFNALIAEHSPRKEGALTDFDAVISGAAEDDSARVEAARAYAKRLALTPPSEGPGYAFVNGKFFDLDDVSSTSPHFDPGLPILSGLFPQFARRASCTARALD